MSDDYMDITPQVHFLESIRADRGSWATLLAEAVDNSLDADATEIGIQLETQRVIVADNGRGIAKAHEKAIVTLGLHVPLPGTKLGRFGMGIKYNAVSAGDLLEVDSIASDGHMVLQADWTKVLRREKWEVPRPMWEPVLVGRGTGTTITIGRLRWALPKDKDVLSARDYLAQVFYPAINHGAVIRLNGSRVPLLREPALSDLVEHTIQLPNGKGAQVRAGILVEPAESLYGVQVSYKHRVVLAKSAFGCGAYGGFRRMFARVTLTADWGLSRFKDALTDHDAVPLEDAVQEVLRPILEKCHNAQLELRIDEIAERLNELLPIEIQAARPPRVRKEATARRPRKDGHHGLTDHDPARTGPARMPQSPERLRVAFDGPLCDEHGYGMFTKGRPNRITLATDNPDIAALLIHRDSAMALRSLFAIALMIYHHALEVEPGQQRLPLEDADAPFGLRVWKTAARQGVRNEATSSAGEN